MTVDVFTMFRQHEASDETKFIDVFQNGKHKAKSDDFQRKSLACECENNCLLYLLHYGDRE